MTINVNKLEKTGKTIDITPKWEGIMPLFIDWLEHGVESQKELARSELKKIAAFLDSVNKRNEPKP